VRLQSDPEFLKILSVLRIEMKIIPNAQSFEYFIIDKIKSCQKKKGK
jgi:hypothetical protein